MPKKIITKWHHLYIVTIYSTRPVMYAIMAACDHEYLNHYHNLLLHLVTGVIFCITHATKLSDHSILFYFWVKVKH